jgi:cell division protein FtsN
MARDYKPKRKRPGSGFSGWIGVACGLAAGLAIAAVVYVKDHRPEASGIKVVAKTDKKRSRVADPGEADGAEPGAADDSSKSYAFYDMLPKFEVVVPEKDKEVRPDARAVPETRSGTYVLQAGSYKNFSDADRVRAKLALQGVESKVQKVSVDNDTWHRIRIGPISNLDELNRLRSILRKADVDVLVIRVGD